ncbi:hypothetical protein TraAM80_06337, partial [Trypanosoma rangeli]
SVDARPAGAFFATPLAVKTGKGRRGACGLHRGLLFRWLQFCIRRNQTAQGGFAPDLLGGGPPFPPPAEGPYTRDPLRPFLGSPAVPHGSQLLAHGFAPLPLTAPVKSWWVPPSLRTPSSPAASHSAR